MHQRAGSNLPVVMECFRMTAETEEEKMTVLHLFFTAVGEKVDSMERVTHGSDDLQWNHAAHYIKGAAANLGMQPLAEQCRRAEIAQGLSSREATLMVDAIRQELQRIRKFLAE